MIGISKDLQDLCPALSIGWLQAQIKNSLTDHMFWNEIGAFIVDFRNKYKRDEISGLPEICEARKLYKSLGNDPARYRVSSEALLRRILSGQSLYPVNTCVDIANYLSLRYQLSMCVYDLDKIQGKIVLRSGKQGETMNAIGGIQMNMAALPVYSDETGIIGSTTRDSLQTSVQTDTKMILLIATSFSSETKLKDVMLSSEKIYNQYCDAKIIHSGIGI